MNQLNPLHIGILLLSIVAFAIFKLSSIKTELVEEDIAFKNSEKLAVKLSGLKSVYADKKKIKKSLNRILHSATLSHANLNIKESKKSIKIVSKSIDALALNYLMGKILNSAYRISDIKIKKLSEEKASLNLEIKW